VMEHHDRARFSVTAFSFGPVANDPARERVRKACDRFEHVDGASDAEIAALARRLGVDVAIDLMGHTERARPGIFCHRAAPAQAQYLGFPGTMGTAAMDFLVADATVAPDAERAHYSERVTHLPATYQANDAAIDIVPAPRGKLGLPEEAFVFCCFNDRLKITPEAFAAWMRILRATPGSILWLVDGGAIAGGNLRREAGHAGIDASRIHFAPRVPLAEHIARCAAADLALDTFPYSGHATTSDMLRAGVPVVTLLGTTFAGRVAASLLGAIALPELIAGSLPAYESLAIALAGDRTRLAAIRERVIRNRATEPLFDIARFTRDLEQAFEAMLGIP
jgi:protein O-GlcNAc transferase